VVCKHEFVRKVVRGEFKGGVMVVKCAVLHYYDDGSFAPSCIECPDCHKYIGYQEQEEMMKERR